VGGGGGVWVGGREGSEGTGKANRKSGSGGREGEGDKEQRDNRQVERRGRGERGGESKIRRGTDRAGRGGRKKREMGKEAWQGRNGEIIGGEMGEREGEEV